MTKLVVAILVVGIVALGLWAYSSGAQLEGCSYLIDDFIVCGKNWGVLDNVL